MDEPQGGFARAELVIEDRPGGDKHQTNRKGVRAMNEPQGGFARADYKQVGGDHYKTKAIQPWEVIERHGMGFFDGNALKYLMRYQDKNGVEDLKKAIHYIEKLIEMEDKNK